MVLYVMWIIPSQSVGCIIICIKRACNELLEVYILTMVTMVVRTVLPGLLTAARGQAVAAVSPPSALAAVEEVINQY